MQSLIFNTVMSYREGTEINSCGSTLLENKITATVNFQSVISSVSDSMKKQPHHDIAGRILGCF